jgi:hypothetical protein
MPVDDWQFWVVTMIAIGAVAVVLRPFLRLAKQGTKPGVSKGATLTIEGKKKW